MNGLAYTILMGYSLQWMIMSAHPDPVLRSAGVAGSALMPAAC